MTPFEPDPICCICGLFLEPEKGDVFLTNEDLKVGDRVSKTYKTKPKTFHTSYGTVAYVKSDRVGVTWDERAPYVFPALLSEIDKAREETS